MKTKKQYFRWLKLFATIASILFLAGGIAVVATGGYRFEFLGVRISSNSITEPLIGFTAFALLRFAISVRLAEFALFLCAICFSLFIFELLLRLLNPPQAAPALIQVHSPSDIYSYELKPNSRGVGTLGERISINSQGARDSEFDPVAPGPRIVVLGDSFTFGMGVPIEEGFVDQMEALLNKRHSGAQVVNLGVIAYSLWQYLEVLERRVPSYAPDLVIVALFMDDLVGAKRPQKVVPRQPFEVRRDDWSTQVRLINVVRNFLVTMEAKYRGRRGVDYLESIEKRKHHLRLENPDHLYAKIQQGKLEPSTLVEFANAINSLSSWSTRTGVPVLAVFIPDATQLHEPERQVANSIVAAEFARVGIPLLDVTSQFEAFEDVGTLFLFPLDAHTNEKGHSVIADAIANHSLVLGLK